MDAENGLQTTPRRFERRIARVAAAQYGVFSREQALAREVPASTLRRRALSGRWEVVFPGVYRVAGVPATWHQTVMAACLVAGRGSGASHRCAAALWSVNGFEPRDVELVVARMCRHPVPAVVHRPRNLVLGDLTRIGPIPVTTPVRTLIDLAAVVPETGLEEALDDALRRGLVTVPRIAARLENIGSVRGIKIIRRLLAERDPLLAAPDSVLETRLLRVLRRARLPPPTPQFEIRRNGRRFAVLDFAYPNAKVAIEADGFRWHGGKGQWQRDLRRRNALTALGWRVIHVTWHDLRGEPGDIVRMVADALRD